MLVKIYYCLAVKTVEMRKENLLDVVFRVGLELHGIVLKGGDEGKDEGKNEGKEEDKDEGKDEVKGKDIVDTAT